VKVIVAPLPWHHGLHPMRGHDGHRGIGNPLVRSGVIVEWPAAFAPACGAGAAAAVSAAAATSIATGRMPRIRMVVSLVAIACVDARTAG
jgi:hypothetical protein